MINRVLLQSRNNTILKNYCFQDLYDKSFPTTFPSTKIETIMEDKGKGPNFKSHVKFSQHMLNVLPTPYQSQDSNRLTLMYFVVGALDLLGEIDKLDKKSIVDYVYS